jgi:hypothetical protein
MIDGEGFESLSGGGFAFAHVSSGLRLIL